MCYIDLQHYIYRKYSDAQFHSCWNPSSQRYELGGGDHTVYRTSIHAYDRPCKHCYEIVVERANNDLAVKFNGLDDLSVRRHLRKQSVVEIMALSHELQEDRDHKLNQTHHVRMVARMFYGGIYHIGALTVRRTKFRLRSTHTSEDPDFPAEALHDATAHNISHMGGEITPTTNTQKLL
jgi:hypothetical protein